MSYPDATVTNIYTSQQKKQQRDFFEIYAYRKTIVYYHLRQCLRETRLSSQSKQQHPVALWKKKYTKIELGM